MSQHEDLFESVRNELKLTPSESFHDDVMARVDAESVGASGKRQWWMAGQAAAGAADVNVPASDIAIARTDSATPSAPVTTTSSRSGRQPVTSDLMGKAPDRAFDPFTDVLLDPAEQRGVIRLAAYRRDASVLPELKSFSVEEPVRILAHNAPAPLQIPLLSEQWPAGTSDGSTR